MFSLQTIQKAIREEKLDGWLFCNFAHRDILTDSLLSLDTDTVSSRRWFYFVPPEGIPDKIVHTIEKDILDSLPGTVRSYPDRTIMETLLRQFSGLRVAVLSDPYIQVLSTMDASSFYLVHTCGMETVTAATLIQRLKGILDAEGIASHEKAGSILYAIVHQSWNLVKEAFRTEKPLYEGDIQDFMLDRFDEEGLIQDHPPIVAAGNNSGNPHYSIPFPPRSRKNRGKKLEKNDVVQFDLWAKFPSGIYADISWVGFCGTAVPDEILGRFKAVLAARDLVKPAVKKAFNAHKPITGAELDAQVRSFLLSQFPSGALQHRTGHGIDTDCHGSGTHLDSVEFPDHRLILEGSCFSVEPGLYFPDSGFRTEIDIYIHDGEPVISGGEIQKKILTLQDNQ
jgi:Xaa-Pro aminopeptidase